MATIYLLTKVDEPLRENQKQTLVKNLTENYAQDWRDIKNGSFLVAAPTTDVTEDVSRKAGISDGHVGAYIVSPITSYFGWANNSVWEWIEGNR